MNVQVFVPDPVQVEPDTDEMPLPDPGTMVQVPPSPAVIGEAQEIDEQVEAEPVTV